MSDCDGDGVSDDRVVVRGGSDGSGDGDDMSALFAK